MKTARRFGVLLGAFVLAAGVLAGCAKRDNETTASRESTNATTESATMIPDLDEGTTTGDHETGGLMDDISSGAEDLIDDVEDGLTGTDMTTEETQQNTTDNTTSK